MLLILQNKFYRMAVNQSTRVCVRHCSHLIRQHHRNLHLAVIGSGPAGFYFTGSLLRKLPDATVDLYERQPVPFGLARFGVAPDHPEVKNCIHQFEKLFTGDMSSRISFVGNVAVGQDVTIDELRSHYDAVVCAYGADGDRKMGIPGEDLGNSLTARQFVGWYNGLPQAQDLNLNFDCDHAMIVGAGNVALDVARILLAPVDKLAQTDINQKTLDMLSSSRIRRVTMVARRGPLQVAFTIKELREMVQLQGCVPKVDDLLRCHDVLSPKQIKSLPRPRQRLIKLLQEAAQGKARTIHPQDEDRLYELLFMRSPTAILADSSGENVGGVKLVVNEYKEGVDKMMANLPEAADAGVRGTDVTESVECGLVLSSIGYQSVQMPGLPFDALNNVIPTETDQVTVKGMSGVYACGWCARGAVGVIATTQTESANAAQIVADQVKQGVLKESADKEGLTPVISLLADRNVDWVSWPDWLNIDVRETELGKRTGRPRQKLTNTKYILDLIHKFRRQ